MSGLGTNLFSIEVATDSGIDMHFTKDSVAFVKGEVEIMSGQRVGKSLYHLKVIAKNSDGRSHGWTDDVLFCNHHLHMGPCQDNHCTCATY